MALNEDEPEPVEDLLEPDYEEMQRFNPVINKFKNAFSQARPGSREALEELEGKASCLMREEGSLDDEIKEDDLTMDGADFKELNEDRYAVLLDRTEGEMHRKVVDE